MNNQARTFIRRVAAILVIASTAVVLTVGESRSLRAQSDGATEELLASAFDEGDARDLAVMSGPQRSHVIWREKRMGDWVAVVDGKASQPFDDIAQLTLAADSGTFAFAAKRGAVWMAVVDGKPGPAYEMVVRLTLSKDGRRHAYTAKRRGKWVMVLDGQESAEFEGVNPWSDFSAGVPVFSDDSRRFGYHGKLGGKWHVWIDGVPALAAQAAPVFSPDSKRVGYIVQTGREAAIAIDGVTGPRFPHSAGPVMFSEDSQRVAYLAGSARRGRFTAVLDGTVESEVAAPSLTGSSGWRAVLSPNGRRITYLTKQQGGVAVVVDGKVQPTFKYVSKPVFSPDSSHVAYRASPDDWLDLPDPVGEFAVPYGVDVPKRWRMVLDGVASEEYGAVTLPRFWPDGRLYYVAGRHAARQIVETFGDKSRSTDSAVNLLADRNLKAGAGPGGGGLLGMLGFALGDLLTDALKRDTRIVEHPTPGANGVTMFVIVDGGGKFANRSTEFARRTVVRDGEAGKPYDAHGLDRLVFDSTGRILAFELHGVRDLEAAKAGKPGEQPWSQVVVNGVDGPRYDAIIHGTLRVEADERITYFAVRDKQLFRVTQQVGKAG